MAQTSNVSSNVSCVGSALQWLSQRPTGFTADDLRLLIIKAHTGRVSDRPEQHQPHPHPHLHPRLDAFERYDEGEVEEEEEYMDDDIHGNLGDNQHGREHAEQPGR